MSPEFQIKVKEIVGFHRKKDPAEVTIKLQDTKGRNWGIPMAAIETTRPVKRGSDVRIVTEGDDLSKKVVKVTDVF